MCPVLHPNTVRALVEYICDIGGPYERPVWRLPEFFCSAGWHEVPEYDGPTRPQWVAQRLEERSSDRVAIEQVLRQLCDQREYGSVQDAADVRDSLNEVLAREGLRVDYQDGRPVVIDIDLPSGVSARRAPIELSVDFGRIIGDRRMVEILRARYAEASICRDNNRSRRRHRDPGELGRGSALRGLDRARSGDPSASTEGAASAGIQPVRAHRHGS